jgi:hypothetical protein
MEKGPDAMAYLKKVMDQQGGYEAATAFTKALTPGQGLDAFSIGSVGLAMNGNSTPGNYDKYSPNLKYSLSKGPLFPQFGEPANYDGGGGLFFFKKGKNFDGAWALAQFMMDQPFYIKFSNQFNSMPARSDVATDWAKADSRREIFAATANTVHWIPIIAGTMGILSYMQTMFDNVMFGKDTIDKALPAFAAQVQTIVDEFNSFAPPTG